MKFEVDLSIESASVVKKNIFLLEDVGGVPSWRLDIEMDKKPLNIAMAVVFS